MKFIAKKVVILISLRKHADLLVQFHIHRFSTLVFH